MAIFQGALCDHVLGARFGANSHRWLLISYLRLTPLASNRQDLGSWTIKPAEPFGFATCRRFHNLDQSLALHLQNARKLPLPSLASPSRVCERTGKPAEKPASSRQLYHCIWKGEIPAGWLTVSHCAERNTHHLGLIYDYPTHFRKSCLFFPRH